VLLKNTDCLPCFVTSLFTKKRSAMLNLDITLETEKKLNYILSRQDDDDAFFSDIINRRINDLKRGINGMTVDLQEFEKKYKMATNQFYPKFAKGKMGDEDDFMVWAGLVELLEKNKKEMKELEW
jgi:hypothetical protein